MSTAFVNLYDRRGRYARQPHSTDLWALYAALARDTEGAGIVKIGVSSRPVIRIGEVNRGSPFPIMAFLWNWVGRRDQAYQLERLVKLQFAARKLRGEWFHFDFTTGSGDKVEFHREIKRLAYAVTGKSFDWTVGDMAGVRAYNQLDKALAKEEGRLNKRKKPKGWG